MSELSPMNERGCPPYYLTRSGRVGPTWSVQPLRGTCLFVFSPSAGSFTSPFRPSTVATEDVPPVGSSVGVQVGRHARRKRLSVIWACRLVSVEIYSCNCFLED